MLGDWQKKKKSTSAGIEAIEIYCRECVCVCVLIVCLTLKYGSTTLSYSTMKNMNLI